MSSIPVGLLSVLGTLLFATVDPQGLSDLTDQPEFIRVVTFLLDRRAKATWALSVL